MYSSCTGNAMRSQSGHSDDITRFFPISHYQGSHRSGKSGKFLKTFSIQGNQSKNRVFSAKIMEKCLSEGTFFQNHFQTF